MVTGSEDMDRKSSSKSSCCMGRSLLRACFRSSVEEARIIVRTCGNLSGEKNMCSVRQSPMPRAPDVLAFKASSGVSAFARMVIGPCSMAHPMIVWRALCSVSEAWSGIFPANTRPVEASRESQSPSRKTRSRILSRPASESTWMSLAAVMQHLPMPRATTAA